MIQITTVRLALFTVLALGSAYLADAKNSGSRIRENASATTSKVSVANELSSSDWSSIRAAYEAGRHAAVPAGGGFRFRNPGQQWSTQFDGRGFVTKPDGNTWLWGLELQSYGIGADQKTVGNKAHISAEGQQVSYHWGDTLTEWYKNDTRGLEHGYTVHSRPANANGLLTFKLAMRGDLRPFVQPNKRDVQFVDQSGATVLTYTGLTVVDASGKALSAQFESTNNALLLSVDDASARYPLTVDPIAQRAYLKASNTGADDTFGYSVAVSADTVVIGAPSEDSNATGVNGDQTNNSASDAGAAYVFVRSGATWTQQAYLKASNTGMTDNFGRNVAVSGDTIVVTATLEDSNATGVNGDQSNNGAENAGAAYVFVRIGKTWSQQAYLKASNTESSDEFGSSVSVSGDTVVLGSYLEDSAANGVNGDQTNNTFPNAGAAYVFVRSGVTWSQEAYLKSSLSNAGDLFAFSVAVSVDTVVVSSPTEDCSSVGVNGTQGNNGSNASGAVYVFVRSGTTWSQQAYIKASNTSPDDSLGYSVSVSGNTLVAGAWHEDSNASSVNGDQSNNGTSNSGAAYVFVRSGTTWSQQAYLKASNPGIDDLFGYSVSVSGNSIVVGAPAEDSNATGVNSDQSNNSAADSGSAYVFIRSGNTWSQQASLKASNTGLADYFGLVVAVSGDTVVVGAVREDSNAIGVDGDQNNNSTLDSGAAYIYDMDNDFGISVYGTGTPGCAGTQTLSVNHAPMINSPHFTFSCNNAPPSSLGLGLVTDSQDLAGSDPFALGVLLHTDFALATEIIPIDFYSDASGYSETVGVTIPNNPAVIGVAYYVCVLWAWPPSTCVLPGFNPYNLSTSRGLALTILAP